MGAFPSLLTRKIASSSTESDPFEVSSALEQVMAESRPRDVARQQSNEPLISIKEEIRRHSTSLQDVQEFLNRTGVILDRQSELESELKTCQERLKGFTRDHARQSESNVENISSANSPTMLERKYEQFYDHERMDAVEHIDVQRYNRDKWSETRDQYVACLIFEESFAAAQTLRNNFLQGISLIVTSAPGVGEQYSEAIKKKSKEFQFSVSTGKPGIHPRSLIGQISENSLKVIMKETAELCDIKVLVQRTLNSLQKRQEGGDFQGYNQDFFLKSSLKKYIEKCCKYTWKLVCQTPPYIIAGNSSLKPEAPVIFNPAIHQPSRESQSPERSSGYISWIVWPGLFDGEATRVIRKTEVMLSKR